MSGKNNPNVDIPGLLGNINLPPRTPVEPDEFLASSIYSSGNGNGARAIAEALQGMLRLQIIQHLQVHGMMESAEEAKVLAAEQKQGARHLFGECAVGHEFFMPDCGACKIAYDEAAEYVDDTVEVSDDFKDAGE